MNKAFCREPDTATPPRCPSCGNEGAVVSPETLAAHVDRPETLGEPACFCGTDACDVAYFDLLERTIGVGEARGLFWPRDPSGPICDCHGLTADDIDAAIVSGDLTRVREVLRLAGEPTAACGTRSADGRPCAGRVQRYFLRRRQELGG